MRTAASSLVLILCFVLLPPQTTTAQEASNATRTVLTNATVIDATGGPALPDTTVIIEGGRIVAIEPGDYSERAGLDAANVRVFDLDGGYVLPGLWNNHTHLSDLLPDPKNVLAYEPVVPAVIRAGRNAMDALRRGFTGLRMTGERDSIDVGWRDAFNAGVFVGPRIPS